MKRVSNAIDEARNIVTSSMSVGLAEKSTSESALETSSLCVNLFREMGAEVSLCNIDVAHRVSTRHERGGPKPVICKFVRRLAKGKVMEARQRASEVNPTSIGLSAENELGAVRIFDHLTPKTQKLLFEAKNFKDENHYRFGWAKNLLQYLFKEG